MRTNKLKLKQKEKRTKDEKQKGKCIISKKNLLDASLLLVADRTVTDQLEGRMSKKSQEKPRLISRIYPWWKQQSVSQWVTATPERWWLVSELPKRHWTTLNDTERHWTTLKDTERHWKTLNRKPEAWDVSAKIVYPRRTDAVNWWVLTLGFKLMLMWCSVHASVYMEYWWKTCFAAWRLMERFSALTR